MGDRYRFVADLWEWTARPEWFFVSVPQEISEDIEDRPRLPRGFGSVPVRVTIGSSQWETSIFPESGSGCYALPIKKAVRRAQDIAPGAPVEVELELRE